MNTVVKSSIDWDNFKEKEGLEDELLSAQKEGYVLVVIFDICFPVHKFTTSVRFFPIRYLTRKDFLDRVDYRKFEIERDERMKARATNMPTSGSGGTDAL